MNEKGVRQLLSSAAVRRSLMYVATGLLAAVAVLVLGEEVKWHIDSIEAWILHLGRWGVVAFVGLFVVATSLLVPESILAIMAGALFGMKWGIFAVVAGNLLAALCQYVLGRNILRKRIERFVASKPNLTALVRAAHRNEFVLQALVRLTPMNPATMSYLFAAVGVRLPGFLLAFLALFPHLLLEVYFGYAARHAVGMTGYSSSRTIAGDLGLFGGLVVTAIVLVVVSKRAHRAVLKVVAENETEIQAPSK